jgi:hypothetical protein
MEELDVEIKIKEKEAKILQEQLELLYMKKARITQKPETQEAVKPTQERANPINEKANPLNEESPMEKRWYVVYNGPKPGIYGTWPEASKAISGICGLIHKSFENRIEAEGSYKEFNMPKLLTPNDFIKTLVDREGSSYRNKVRDSPPTNRFTFLGKTTIAGNPTEHFKEGLRKITPELFFQFYNKARVHTGESMEEDCFFTTDRNNGSRYNLLDGSDPKFVYQLYQCGLIDNIYPSNNLVELSFFPENFKRTIRNFRKRIKAADRPIYLKFYSSIIDWNDNGEELIPYHFIKLGLASPKREVPQPFYQEPKETDPDSLHEERAHLLSTIFQELRKINAHSDIRINYSTTKVLIYSQSNTTLLEEDQQKIIEYEARFIGGILDINLKTRHLFCQLNRKRGTDHLCNYCQGVGPPEDEKEDVGSRPSTDDLEE